MTITKTDYRYIEIDETGIPRIAGSTIKVVEIIETQLAYGWSPEEIHLNHRYLSMSQILSALAYYWDFKTELDTEIQRREDDIKQAEQKAGESPFAARLRQEGYLK